MFSCVFLANPDFQQADFFHLKAFRFAVWVPHQQTAGSYLSVALPNFQKSPLAYASVTVPNVGTF